MDLRACTPPVFLPNAAPSVLHKRHIGRVPSGGLLSVKAWQETDLLIDRGDGGPVNPSTFSTAWRVWAKREGFEAVGGFH